jgi:hypothetical protein
VTPKKAKLMQRSCAEVFRNEALSLIDEHRFAPMYHPDNGRPNRPSLPPVWKSYSPRKSLAPALHYVPCRMCPIIADGLQSVHITHNRSLNRINLSLNLAKWIC